MIKSPVIGESNGEEEVQMFQVHSLIGYNNHCLWAVVVLGSESQLLNCLHLRILVFLTFSWSGFLVAFAKLFFHKGLKFLWGFLILILLQSRQAVQVSQSSLHNTTQLDVWKNFP